MRAPRPGLPRGAASRLLLTSWLFGASNGLSAPILGLYLFTQGSFLASVEFYLVNAASILATYIAVGEMSGRVRSASSLYRPGVALLASFYASLVALGRRASGLAPELGAYYGASQGLYWSGWDVAYFELVADRLAFFNRLAYLGFATSLALPAIYGGVLAALGARGYVALFAATASGLAAVGALMPDLRVSLGPFSARRMVALAALDRRYGGLVAPLAALFGYGYATSYVNPILTYVFFGRSYRLFAAFNYAMSALGVAVVRLRASMAGRFGKGRLLLASSSALAASAAAAALERAAIPAYLALSAIFSQLVTFVDVDTWNSMSRERFAEYMTNRHLMLNSGRALATALVYAASQAAGPEMAAPVAGAFALAGSLGYYLRLGLGAPPAPRPGPASPGPARRP